MKLIKEDKLMYDSGTDYFYYYDSLKQKDEIKLTLDNLAQQGYEISEYEVKQDTDHTEQIPVFRFDNYSNFMETLNSMDISKIKYRKFYSSYNDQDVVGTIVPETGLLRLSVPIKKMN